MKKSLKVLCEERSQLLNEFRPLVEKAKGGTITGAESIRLEAVKKEVREVTADIVNAEREKRQYPDGKYHSVLEHDQEYVVAPGNPKGDSEATGGFRGIGDFMSALFRKSRGDMDDRLRPLASAVNENDPASGGFAVPPQYVEAALQSDFDEGAGEVLLNSCDRVPMTSNDANIPGYADASHATTAPYGITWSQLNESDSFGNAQVPPFKKVELHAKKSGALFAISNEWLADASGAMQARLQNIFQTSLRWYVENRLWRGSGAGEPLGVLNSAATLSIPKEVGQESASIYTENIVKMWARLRPGSHSRAIWVANPTTFPQLATLTVGTGTAGVLTGLLQTNRGVAGEPATAIFGRPLYLAEHLPAIGAAGDIVLLDPLLYIFGDRQQITMDASPHVRFTYDETTFRVKARFDGQPALGSVLTPANGDTLAWAVKLAVRS